MKFLIVNADDFGNSRKFNEKILEQVEEGHITSVSVMVERIDESQNKQVEKLKELAKAKDASVGLHIEFATDSFREEIEKQHSKFSSIFGFEPSHIDMHKKKRMKMGYPEIIKYCAEHSLPCKDYGFPSKAVMPNRTYAATGRIFDEIEEWLKTLKDNETYLIEFHPGNYDPESKSTYNKIREVDAKLIEKLSSILEKYDIKLVSFFHLVK